MGLRFYTKKQSRVRVQVYNDRGGLSKEDKGEGGSERHEGEYAQRKIDTCTKALY